MLPRGPNGGPRDLSRPLEKVEIIVDEERGGSRLDKVLQSYLPWRSRTGVCKLIDGGYVDHMGHKPRASRKVRAGDRIVITIPQAPVPDVGPTDFEIPILYEDQWIIVVDKPAGLAVHPSGRRVYGTLIHFLHKRYRSDDPAHDVVPRLLHRLDRETSGVVAAGLDDIVHTQIRAQFEDRTVSKSYLAVAHGRPAKSEGVIDVPLGPARRSEVRLKQEVRDDGLVARTDYRVVRSNERYSLVELTPHTGRTHQLRVHMEWLGCPLVGDKLYGVDESVFLEYLRDEISDATREQLVLDRHALHAARLKFRHFGRDEDVEFVAELPADMAALVPE